MTQCVGVLTWLKIKYGLFVLLQVWEITIKISISPSLNLACFEGNVSEVGRVVDVLLNMARGVRDCFPMNQCHIISMFSLWTCA